jgi:hypothetical protein
MGLLERTACRRILVHRLLKRLISFPSREIEVVHRRTDIRSVANRAGHDPKAGLQAKGIGRVPAGSQFAAGCLQAGWCPFTPVADNLCPGLSYGLQLA